MSPTIVVAFIALQCQTHVASGSRVNNKIVGSISADGHADQNYSVSTVMEADTGVRANATSMVDTIGDQKEDVENNLSIDRVSADGHAGNNHSVSTVMEADTGVRAQAVSMVDTIVDQGEDGENNSSIGVAAQTPAPNAGARCCQRKRRRVACCTKDQLKTHDYKQCRGENKGQCRHRETEVTTYLVVWQYKQNGGTVSECLPDEHEGDWWSFASQNVWGRVLTLGFGSPSMGADGHCNNPITASSDSEMYALSSKSPMEMTNAAPPDSRCCFCNKDVSWTSYYSKTGECESMCKHRGGLHSADPPAYKKRGKSNPCK